jgi:hypothetical protein
MGQQTVQYLAAPGGWQAVFLDLGEAEAAARADVGYTHLLDQHGVLLSWPVAAWAVVTRSDWLTDPDPGPLVGLVWDFREGGAAGPGRQFRLVTDSDWDADLRFVGYASPDHGVEWFRSAAWDEVKGFRRRLGLPAHRDD